MGMIKYLTGHARVPRQADTSSVVAASTAARAGFLNCDRVQMRLLVHVPLFGVIADVGARGRVQRVEVRQVHLVKRVVLRVQRQARLTAVIADALIAIGGALSFRLHGVAIR